MSATITPIKSGYDVWGKTRAQLATVKGDASYPVGGYPVTAASVGFESIEAALNAGTLDGTNSGAYTPVWDQLNGKLRLWVAGSEVSPTTDVHLVQFNMLFLGN